MATLQGPQEREMVIESLKARVREEDGPKMAVIANHLLAFRDMLLARGKVPANMVKMCSSYSGRSSQHPDGKYIQAGVHFPNTHIDVDRLGLGIVMVHARDTPLYVLTHSGWYSKKLTDPKDAYVIIEDYIAEGISAKVNQDSYWFHKHGFG